ncbi:MAG: thioredoxin family protein [Bacteroidota bacterium]
MAERPTTINRPEEPQPGLLQSVNYHFTLTNSATLEAPRTAFYPNDPFRQAVKSLRTPTHFLTNHTDRLPGKQPSQPGLTSVVHAGIILLLFLYFFFTVQHFSTAERLVTIAYSSAGVEPEFQPKPSSTAMLGGPLVSASATDKHNVEAEPKDVLSSTAKETGSPLPAKLVAGKAPAWPADNTPLAVEEDVKVVEVLVVIEEVMEEMAIARAPEEEGSLAVEAVRSLEMVDVSPVSVVGEQEQPVEEVVVKVEEYVLVAEAVQVEEEWGIEEKEEGEVKEDQMEQSAVAKVEPVEEVQPIGPLRREGEEEPQAVKKVVVVAEEELVIESLELLKQSALAEGKLFFMIFGAKWCLPCKVMEKTTFQDTELKAYIAEHYLSLKVDVDDFDGYNLKQIYQVKALPTLLIFNSQGEVLERLEASMSATTLMEQLQKYNLPEHRSVSPQPEPAIAPASTEELEALSAQVQEFMATKRLAK